MRAMKIKRPKIAPNFIQDHCDVQGCEKPHRAKGLCISHYSKDRKGVNVFMERTKEQKLIEQGEAQAIERIIAIIKEESGAHPVGWNYDDWIIALIKESRNV